MEPTTQNTIPTPEAVTPTPPTMQPVIATPPRKNYAKLGGTIGLSAGGAVVLIFFVLSSLNSPRGENYFFFLFPIIHVTFVLGLGLVGAILGRFWHSLIIKLIALPLVIAYILYLLSDFLG